MNKLDFITIIQDCNDKGTKGRITSRFQDLFCGVAPSFVGIDFYENLEAAENLVDILDLTEGINKIVLVNAAPRHGKN